MFTVTDGHNKLKGLPTRQAAKELADKLNAMPDVRSRYVVKLSADCKN